MNNILTIDTSSSRCSVAVQFAGGLIERISDAERQSAQRVLPMVSELLSESGISLAELDVIAVVAGPGSFTGVRIGVAVAQGLGMSQDIPVISLSSLALLAVATVEESACSHVLVCEEAREGEVYFAAYRQSEKLGVELLGSEQVALPEKLLPLSEHSQNAQWRLVGTGWSNNMGILGILNSASTGQVCEPVISNQLIAQQAERRFMAGEAVNADQVRPNYVKEQLDY
jgi:tRNA threonylcarbamoyladenosine biosynthesis protein TsaB